jgi:predicted amidohydrolase
MASVEESVLMAAIQMCSTNSKEDNLRLTTSLVEEAAAKGAKLICLPECSAFMGSSPAETIAAAETTEGPYAAALASLAGRLGVWLSVGGFPEKVAAPSAVPVTATTPSSATAANAGVSEKIGNLHFMISPEGTIVSPTYRKIHLFDSPLAGLTESKSTGDYNPAIIHKLPLYITNICFDAVYTLLCSKPKHLSLTFCCHILILGLP